MRSHNNLPEEDMNKEDQDELSKLYSEYSDEHIRSLLLEGENSFEPSAFKLLSEEAAKRSLQTTSLNQNNESSINGESKISRASRKERFLALLIDYIIFGIVFFPIWIIITGSSPLTSKMANLTILLSNILFFLKIVPAKALERKL